MFKYFREMLATLKLIEKHLAYIAGAVELSPKGKFSITTRPWDDQ